MSVVIRDGDLSRDRQQMIQFVRENLTAQSDEARFDWLYLQNPSGAARVWLALDEPAGRMIGLAGAFPRTMWLDGQAQTGWVLGDFCISREHRSLGPALLLQRRCLESLTSDGKTPCYDFPSLKMAAIYARLGAPVKGKFVRYAKVFKVDSKISSLVSSGVLRQALTTAGNGVLRVKNRLRTVASDADVSFFDEDFGAEFSTLDSAISGSDRFHVSRSAEYLNWRYRLNPLRKYRTVVARRNTELLGYAILEIGEKEGVLSELHAVEESETIPALISLIDVVGDELGLERVNAPLLEGTRLDRYLRKGGFVPREAADPVFLYWGKESSISDKDNVRHWCLMHGDRES